MVYPTRPSLLSDLYTRYVAAGHVSLLLSQLEAAILRRDLPGGPPEVVQALVDHFMQRGQATRVERAVLHMQVTSLDLDQVARGCRRYGLYTALAYLYTRAFEDFVSPLGMMLAAAAAVPAGVAGAPGTPVAGATATTQLPDADVGFRCLTFMCRTLLGRSWPPTEGAGGELPGHVATSARLSILAFTLYARQRDLVGYLPEAAKAKLTGPSDPADGGGLDPADVFPGPTPALLALLSIDVSIVLSTWAHVLSGWEVLESEVRHVAAT